MPTGQTGPCDKQALWSLACVFPAHLILTRGLSSLQHLPGRKVLFRGTSTHHLRVLKRCSGAWPQECHSYQKQSPWGSPFPEESWTLPPTLLLCRHASNTSLMPSRTPSWAAPPYSATAGVWKVPNELLPAQMCPWACGVAVGICMILVQQGPGSHGAHLLGPPGDTARSATSMPDLTVKKYQNK